jgi:hypothetical protein
MLFFVFIQWKARNDIVYYDEMTGRKGRNIRMSPLKRSLLSSVDMISSPKRVTVGNSSAADVNLEGSSSNVFDANFRDLDAALARACQLSLQLPTTSVRLSHTAGVLPPGHAFNEEAEKVVLSAEAANLEYLQKTVMHLRQSFGMYKTMQDARCKPFEDNAQQYIQQMSTHDAVVGDEAKNDCGAVGAQGTTDVDAVGAEASKIAKVSTLYFRYLISVLLGPCCTLN